MKNNTALAVGLTIFLCIAFACVAGIGLVSNGLLIPGVAVNFHPVRIVDSEAPTAITGEATCTGTQNGFSFTLNQGGHVEIPAVGGKYIIVCTESGSQSTFVADVAAIPTATTAPVWNDGTLLTLENTCIAFGGNEHIQGNMELVWAESVDSFKHGDHYQYPWSHVSNISQIGSVVLDPTEEHLNDSLQGKFCWDATHQEWKGWLVDRKQGAKLPFWNGISYSKWISTTTMAICQDDVNNACAGTYAELGTTYTFAQMLALSESSDVHTHILAAQVIAEQIQTGEVYIPLKGSWNQWVLQAWQK